MGIIRLIKPGLFVYECVKILMLAFIFVLFMPETIGIPWLVFTASGVMFPLMALFLWLDVYRYKAYLPLFIAGKCIGIFSLLVWTVVSGRFARVFYDVHVIVDFVFLSGDLLALAAVLLILKDTQKYTKKPLPDTEDKQCE
ncbi:MAG: hypothetical protein LBQ93_08340 [Treponema sp.]|jgi:hypothetical protein|nr:hypothetical protein [Treponema sp.]